LLEAEKAKHPKVTPREKIKTSAKNENAM